MAAPLYTPHSRALTILFSDIESHALNQPVAFIGTAGSLLERQNAQGFRYHAHQYYDGDGKKRERYLAGPIGDANADAAAEALRSRIDETKALVPSLRMLGREGYNLADAKTYATLASLHNHGVFLAGGTLIGSHAYGVLLNELGIRAQSYATEDVDIARREALALPDASPPSFLEMLKESGIEFVAVPQLDHRLPATSFKQRGQSRFHVDLLVPSPDDDFPVVPVPELKAHALGLPYLGYLLGDTHLAPLLAREGCCAVRVPSAERFALHKLIVSQIRAQRGSKSEKDVHQACVLLAVLGEVHPGAIDEAARTLPVSAKGYVRASLPAVARLLQPTHDRAWEELETAATG